MSRSCSAPGSYPVPDRAGSLLQSARRRQHHAVLGQKNSITALDAATGTVIWTHMPEVAARSARDQLLGKAATDRIDA